MDLLKDVQGQTTEIVSASLIKTLPSDVNWSEYKSSQYRIKAITS